MAEKPARRREMPLFLALPWWIMWGVIAGMMLLLAIIGLGCVVLGMVSLFVDLSRLLEIRLGGEVVRTATQKIRFMAVGAVMAISGIAFWWLNRRGRTVKALICFAVLMGLFLVVALVTGQGGVISFGGPGH